MDIDYIDNLHDRASAAIIRLRELMHDDDLREEAETRLLAIQEQISLLLEDAKS